ncbi:hypothetical protein ACIBI9_18890 [Nonomuraea sp. NPDC050451]|uniref:hypothetical protein n=1 Tax=Nonomuraea sp. NPDC050451 TaxID=3364364 RepID=UPI003797AE43
MSPCLLDVLGRDAVLSVNCSESGQVRWWAWRPARQGSAGLPRPPPAAATDLFWSPGTPGYPGDLAQHDIYDPAKARKMIQDAGAAVPITVISLPNNTAAAQIVRNNLEDVDVPAFADRQPRAQLGTAFMSLHGLNGLAPTTLVDTLPTLREGPNPSHVEAPEYAELLSEPVAGVHVGLLALAPARSIDDFRTLKQV